MSSTRNPDVRLQDLGDGKSDKAGFRYILWMDSSFQPIDNIKPLLDRLKRDGWYCAPQAQARLGTWSTDYLLAQQDIPREEAMTVQLVYSGLIGLDMRSEIGKVIWHRWVASQADGSWNGAHYNAPGQSLRPFGLKTKGHVSNDPRVEGHRHDEAALSAILHDLDLKPVDRGFLTLESHNGFIGHHVELVVPGLLCTGEKECLLEKARRKS